MEAVKKRERERESIQGSFLLSKLPVFSSTALSLLGWPDDDDDDYNGDAGLHRYHHHHHHLSTGAEASLCSLASHHVHLSPLSVCLIGIDNERSNRLRCVQSGAHGV